MIVIDKNATTWTHVPAESDFPIQNLPYGIFSVSGGSKRVGVAIGDHILDLSLAFEAGLIPGPSVYSREYLNDLMAQGRTFWSHLRTAVLELLSVGHARPELLVPINQAKLHLPVYSRAFVDFYSSEQHASNVGRMFRDPVNPLLPNWKNLPVAYNGRASSIVTSGVPVRRPKGQTKKADKPLPDFGPTQELDFELEMGFFLGVDTEMGIPIPVTSVTDSVFGMVLVNDWSARDVQRWEYAPLGPFLAKSFATSISPWVVPMDALEPFRIPCPTQDPPVLPYLVDQQGWHFDMSLEVGIKGESMKEFVTVCRSNYRNMYWSLAQQLAHLTVNGANVNVGDLCASGTISGDTQDSFGSMLELAWKGEKPVQLGDSGESRVFIKDGDTVRFSGHCQGQGYRVGFGNLENRVLPAN